MVYFDCFGLADTVYVIPREVDKHDMLRSILLRGQKDSAKLLILYGSEVRSVLSRYDTIVTHLLGSCLVSSFQQ